MTETELKYKIAVIEKRLQVLECDHADTEYVTISRPIQHPLVKIEARIYVKMCRKCDTVLFQYDSKQDWLDATLSSI